MDKEWFKTVVRLYLRQNTKKENLAYKEKKVFGRSISEKTTSSFDLIESITFINCYILSS